LTEGCLRCSPYNTLLNSLHAQKDAVLVPATGLSAERLHHRLLCGRVVAVAHLREEVTANTGEAGEARPGGRGVETSGGRGDGGDEADGSDGEDGDDGVFHGSISGNGKGDRIEVEGCEMGRWSEV